MRKIRGRKTVRIYLNARILPAFGRMPLDRIGPGDVAAWFDAATRDKPSAANRAVEILRAMMFRAEEWGLREAVAAIRLLALTGCRHSEVLNLRWRNIGADSLNLEDSKTGPRAVPLGSLRLHDLRHTAASQAVMSGEGLPLVGRLLGHNRHRTTAGYAHDWKRIDNSTAALRVAEHVESVHQSGTTVSPV